MERHRCKFCGKSFPCGRSLGGHMRSHMRSDASTPPPPEKEKLEKSCYGLRENPKKTFKLSNFAAEDHHPASSSTSLIKMKQCKVCAKEFPSWKALFGHMRCHSDRVLSSETEEEDEEEEVSLKKWWKLDSTYEQEQEEVAISLMMLSRDVTACWSIPAESSDKQSEVMEEDELISGEDSGKQKMMTLGEFGKKGSDLNAYQAKLGIEEMKMESRYQCTACNRSFHSYQALGGHRASHKRTRGCCFQNPDADFDAKTDAFVEYLAVVELEDSHSSLSKKRRIHECSVCGKIFASGQALGGHKRSHLVSNADAGSCGEKAAAVAAESAEVQELLDLNLPAPVDEESDNVKPWWVGEQNMMNLLTN